MNFYYTVQAGSWNAANTIWVWPALSIAQISQGDPVEIGHGLRGKWIISVCWLFWAAGVVW
jgi:hypothetical protein